MKLGAKEIFMKNTIKALLVILLLLNFTGCNNGPVEVTDKEITITFNDEEITGIYTGTMENNVPNGTGTFTYNSDERNIVYEGNWEEGSIKGEGYLKDNGLKVYYYHNYDVIGEFEGTVQDGIPNGEGVFKGKNDSNVGFTYTGHFKDGDFNGYGSLLFDDDIHPKCIGNFSNCSFQPSPSEYFSAVASYPFNNYVLDDETAQFINNHEDLFKNNDSENAKEFINSDFSYVKYSKNPSKYEGGLFQVRLTIVQIEENDLSLWGVGEGTYILGYDADYKIYDGYFYGTFADVYENDTVTVIGLPLTYRTYEMLKGGYNNTISFAGVSLTK